MNHIILSFKDSFLQRILIVNYNDWNTDMTNKSSTLLNNSVNFHRALSVRKKGWASSWEAWNVAKKK